jgi:hypothetical protein
MSVKTLPAFLWITLLVIVTPGIGLTQNREPTTSPSTAAAASTPASPAAAGTPLTIDIVFSRFSGEKADKNISTAPYTMAVTGRPGIVQQAPVSSIRMGNRVPIATPVFPPSNDGKPAPLTPFQYQDVGINIDCRASARTDGRYEILLSIEETTVALPPSQVQGVQTASPPVIRTLRFNDTVIVRDGETRQFTAATDRVTGETVKIDVTVKTAK